MENGGGGFFTGRSGAELGKWTSAPTSATFSSFEHSMFPGFVAAGPNQLEFQPQNQQQHLTCLKLGKRQYYGEAADQETAMKREKSGIGIGGVIPRCQVEGCDKSLLDAKDYHRRHKVCEMHSKAPSVVVFGAEQRFCQQCSRFHVVPEFDGTKRSCRRRLAGHNERRRKNANEYAVRNPSLDSPLFGSRSAYLSPSSPGCALSLLSSKMAPWIPTPELSSRSSAALRELIAENRAALLARQLFSNQSVITYVPHQNQVPPPQLLDGWNQFQDSGNHVTLDLMQDPNSASFEFLARNKSKEDEEECCEIWKSLEGTHVV